MHRYATPLGIFLLLLVLLGIGLTLNPRTVPSPLINKPIPAFDLIGLKDPDQRLSHETLRGEVSLLNVWATWCVPCRQEHPLLETLSRDDRVQLVGINYKDKNDNSLRFLGELGNPFAAVGVDPAGKAAIDWGVYGIPETYLVGPDGKVLQSYPSVDPTTHAGRVLEDALTSK